MSCGCAHATDPATGARRIASRCAGHSARRNPIETLGEDYYRDLGLLTPDGRPAETRHVAELDEALGPLPRPRGNDRALEIGCGVSPYVGAIQAAGWRYLGLEASPWAGRFTRDWWDVAVVCSTWEEWVPAGRFGLMLAAHVLEHLANAPAALLKMGRTLEAGGVLLIVVPHGEDDPVNPDHEYFFDEFTLGRAVELAGLAVEVIAVRRIVAHERFIYCRARKGV